MFGISILFWNLSSIFWLNGVSFAQEYSKAVPSLNWVRVPGAEQCICPGDLARKVEERLGREIFFSTAVADIAVEGHIGPKTKGGWKAILVISDHSGKVLGSRVLETEGEDCHELDEALALVIAVSIYPQSGLGGSAIPLPEEIAMRLDKLFGDEPSELNPDVSSTKDESQLEADIENETSFFPLRRGETLPIIYKPRIRWKDAAARKGPPEKLNRDAQGWAVSFVSGLGLGFIPDLTFGIGLVTSLQLPDWRPIDFRMNYWFESNEEVQHETDGKNSHISQIDISMLTTNIGICPFDFGRTETNLRLCGGIGIGALLASSQNTALFIRNTISPFWDFYSGISVNVTAINPIALWIGATIEVPVVPPRIKYAHVSSEGDLESDIESLVMNSMLGKLEIGISIYFF